MNINPTPPNPTPYKPKQTNYVYTPPTLVIQSKEKDDAIWKKIVRYLNQHDRKVEEEYLLIEQKLSKLPSIQRLYIEIYINYNTQLENHLNGKSK